MNKIAVLFDLGYVRMDGIWFHRDYTPYPGQVSSKEPSLIEFLSREGFSILYLEGQVYLKKADPSDLEALKKANVVPGELEVKRLGDAPGWLPSSYVKYASVDIFAILTEATTQRVNLRKGLENALKLLKRAECESCGRPLVELPRLGNCPDASHPDTARQFLELEQLLLSK